MKRVGRVRVALVVLVAWSLLSPGAGRGDEPTPDPDVRAQAGLEAAEPAGPVAVPEPSKKAISYYRSGNVIWVLRQVWGLAVPALLLFTGLSARLRNWARQIGRRWLPAVLLYFVFYSLIDYLLNVPLGYYVGFVRRHAYGLSNQTLGKWAGDSLKGLLVGLIFGCLFVWIPYLLLHLSPRRWWLYVGLLSGPLVALVVIVGPIWVAPLFNDSRPMADDALEAKILTLADRAGIEAGRVFVVDKSVDTKTVNAYVTGLGATHRIVLWDTLIDKLEEDELLFVMGHEMGHYVLGHVMGGVAVAWVCLLSGFYLVHRLAGVCLARWKTRFGFGQMSDVASLPLLILLGRLAWLLLIPLALCYSRHTEREADRFGLEITRNNRAAAMAFVKLQEQNLGHPRPGLFYKLWRGSHPTIAERIEFVNGYRPWEKGEELRYRRHFAPFGRFGEAAQSCLATSSSTAVDSSAGERSSVFKPSAEAEGTSSSESPSPAESRGL